MPNEINESLIGFADPMPCNITISLKEKVVVTIKEDGTVEYEGAADEAAVAFWQALERMNPWVTKLADLEQKYLNLKVKLEKYEQMLTENQKEFLRRLDP